MNRWLAPIFISEFIRKPVAGVLLGFSMVSLYSLLSFGQTVTMEISRTINVQDPQNPRASLGRLSAGSQVTLTLPAGALNSLGGRTRISNGELIRILDQAEGVHRLQTVQINAVGTGSSTTASTGAVDLRTLLRSDGVRLDEIRPGTAVTPQARAEPQVRAGAPAAASPSQTRMEAQADCFSCFLARLFGPSTTTAQNVNDLRAVAAAGMQAQQPDARSVTAAVAEVEAYSNSRGVQRMIAAAMRTPPRLRRTSRRCYHYVKSAVYSGGLAPPRSLDGGSAYEGVEDLRSQGFVNLITDSPYSARYSSIVGDPDQAPVGSILVYEGDRSGPAYMHGDIQIRTSNGYVNDIFSPRAMTNQRTGEHYRLIGVMIRPNAGS